VPAGQSREHLAARGAARRNAGKSLAAAILLGLAGGVGGCRPAPLRLGSVPAGAAPVALADIARRPERHAGRPVRVRGRITRVCRHVGCWFYLTDGSAELYVDLEGGLRFVVPTNSTGRLARVAGVVRVDHGQPRLVARAVELP
jgi:hypothetical protein